MGAVLNSAEVLVLFQLLQVELILILLTLWWFFL
jgi:hypothetical protein